MDFKKLEKATNIKKRLDDYIALQRSINNRDTDRYIGVTIDHSFWDEIGNELQDVIGSKIIELEEEFEEL